MSFAQNAILELKLVAISHLNHADFLFLIGETGEDRSGYKRCISINCMVYSNTYLGIIQACCNNLLIYMPCMKIKSDCLVI